MPKITVSYRRADSEAMTGRICDRLIAHFTKEAVFRDIDDIPAGIDFRQHINDTLLKTNVMLAIVGPKWLGAARGGLERINEDSDPVRVEVETALRRRVPIIPVLIGNTRMPGSDQLPPGLKDFAFRNAVKVDTGRDFDHHMDRLIKSIDSILSQAPKPSAPSRETKSPSPPEAPSARPERPPQTAAPVADATRKRDSGSRPAAQAAAAGVPPAKPLSGKISIPLAIPAGLTRDWREVLWPKSRNGRMLRLASGGAIAVVLMAMLAVNLFSGSSGGGLQRLLSLANSAPVSALAVSSDARQIAAAGLDKTINVWDAIGGSLLGSMRDPDGVSSLAFMPNGGGIVSGGLNGIILIRQPGSDPRTIRTLKPDVTYAWDVLPAVLSIAVSPDSGQIASGSADGSVKIWSSTGELLQNLKAHDNAVTALAYSRDGKTLVSGSKDGTVRLWEVDSGQALATLDDRTGPILSLSISPDGKWIATAGGSQTVLIWDASTGRPAHRMVSKLEAVRTVAFLNGDRLAVGGDDALIELWDAETAQRLGAASGKSRNVRALAVSSGGNSLASGGDDDTIDVWSTD